VVNFGVLYGMTASRLSREFNISRTEGQHIINEYFKSFPSVQEWIDEVIAAARKNGYVTTLSGRRRYIPDIKASSRAVQQNAERVVINTPVQGTSADMIKKAMISIHRELAHSKTKAKMVLQVHDELIFDIPEDEVETLSPVIVRYMENALPLRVPLKVDIKTGNNWAEC